MDESAGRRFSGWRDERGDASLADVHRSVPVKGSFFRRAAAFAGPGYLVAVGYMDPGNWATSIAGGSKFGYTLLVVALVSNIMAIVLQSLCARLAIASGRDLAQACRDAFPKPKHCSKSRSRVGVAPLLLLLVLLLLRPKRRQRQSTLCTRHSCFGDWLWCTWNVLVVTTRTRTTRPLRLHIQPHSHRCSNA